MMIGGKYAVETARLERALEREEQEKKRREEKEIKEAAREKKLFVRYQEWHKEEENLMQELEEPIPEVPSVDDGCSSAQKWVHLQNREHFPLATMAAIRGGVSQRTLANILSSYAVDLGLATKENPSLLVDHAKVGREQKREMERVTPKAEHWMRTSGIYGIQFDGKDENALAWVTLDCGTRVIRHIKEDHITVTDS